MIEIITNYSELAILNDGINEVEVFSGEIPIINLDVHDTKCFGYNRIESFKNYCDMVEYVKRLYTKVEGKIVVNYYDGVYGVFVKEN